MDEEYIHIGKIVAATGLGGQLILKHGLGKRIDLKVKAIFINDSQSGLLPYFVLSGKAKSVDETILQLEGVESREEAKKFIQKPVWLSGPDFRKTVSKNSPLAMLHYKLYNYGELIGEIDEVIEQPHQILAVIKMNQKDVLIPLHRDTLKEIDHKKGEVYVELPEGLLDIYQ